MSVWPATLCALTAPPLPSFTVALVERTSPADHDAFVVPGRVSPAGQSASALAAVVPATVVLSPSGLPARVSHTRYGVTATKCPPGWSGVTGGAGAGGPAPEAFTATIESV